MYCTPKALYNHAGGGGGGKSLLKRDFKKKIKTFIFYFYLSLNVHTFIALNVYCLIWLTKCALIVLV